MTVRLRFAPSPTGYLHVGGLRTALFSYLFAKQQKGTFIFRLEDTDQQRLVVGAEANLLHMLQWAGLTIDEGPESGGNFGPYRQSERLPIYRQYVQLLLDQGTAYPCFCTAERLAQLKEQQKAQGLTTKYDGHCRYLQASVVAQRLQNGEPHVIRMKIPETHETIVMQDLLRGEISIDTEQLDDQVLLKSEGFPTYHLAMVVDDHLMQITHVVRGEEWLPSFPKHILLFRYFGWPLPQFVHLPLILNMDRSKLSKRQGAVAVEEFREQGYLPESLINFIALLGWSSGDDQELFSWPELIEKFDFGRVSKSGAVFDREKLNWMNQQYIQKLELNDLFQRLKPYIARTPFAQRAEEDLKKVCRIVQTYLVRLSDIGEKLALFFAEKPVLSNPLLIAGLQEATAQQVLKNFLEKISTLESLRGEQFVQVVKAVQKDTGIKGKNLWTPLRYALTLEEHGPDLTMIVDTFGKEKCVRLVQQALAHSR